VARQFRVRGPVETISAACASGTLALGAALDALRTGAIDRAVVGGSDSLCQLTHGGFNALRSVDEGPCRPFRADREGLSIGEGAAVLILEAADDALRRGARPLATLLGCGASCDAHHMTAPDPAGAGPARAIVAAFEDAGLGAGDIDFVNAHGTGTPLNDAAEWAALSIVFGERAGSVPVTSTKGVVGHLLGSAGAIEAVATVLCLVARAVHPTPGEGPVDPATPVRLVLGRPSPIDRPWPVAISTSLAFGGSNAAAVLARIPAENE
jgi:3-oxoacyl-[acyl-carrier-protein] synthase II